MHEGGEFKRFISQVGQQMSKLEAIETWRASGWHRVGERGALVRWEEGGEFKRFISQVGQQMSKLEAIETWRASGWHRVGERGALVRWEECRQQVAYQRASHGASRVQVACKSRASHVQVTCKSHASSFAHVSVIHVHACMHGA